MEHAFEGPAKAREFLSSLMPSMIGQLALGRSRRALLVKITTDVPDGMEGATMYIDVADCYLVLIKQPRRLTKSSLINMATTLAHEMVHVRQLAKGQLKYLPREAKLWMGRRYTKKTSYLDQPWEQDAFARQEIIVRRAIE
jgi:hypothetical protein